MINDINELFDYENNEEDFRKLICLYEMSVMDDEDCLDYDNRHNLNFYNKNSLHICYDLDSYNTHYYGFNKTQIRKFVNILKGKYNIVYKNKEYYRIDIPKDILCEKVREYNDKLNSFILSDNNDNNTLTNILLKYRINSYCPVYESITKNINIFIDNKILNITNKYKYCTDIYGIIKYFSYRLNNKREWYEVSTFMIENSLILSPYEIKRNIDILIDKGLIQARKSYTGKKFKYEYKIIPIEDIDKHKSDDIYDIYKQPDYIIKETMKNDPSMYYIIYEITDLTNGMKYIGKHMATNINDGYMGSGRLLKQNQEIKGMENFTKKILHLCKNEQHMNEMERYEIEKVKAYENNMYYNLI